MHIDTSILDNFYNDKLNQDSHWIFSKIKQDEILFEEIYYDKETIYSASTIIKNALNNFEPFNKGILLKLFPDFFANLNEVTIILSVGIPSPYDALVREHEGKECII